MGKKGIDLAKAECTIADFNTYEPKLDELTDSVSSIQEPLLDCWEGDEAETCVEFVANLASKMSEMSSQVAKVRKWLENVRDSYDELATSGAKNYTLN